VCNFFSFLFLRQSSEDDDEAFVANKKIRSYNNEAASGTESDESEEVDFKVAREKPKGKKLTTFAL
jgi:hypothetical protein